MSWPRGRRRRVRRRGAGGSAGLDAVFVEDAEGAKALVGEGGALGEGECVVGGEAAVVGVAAGGGGASGKGGL